MARPSIDLCAMRADGTDVTLDPSEIWHDTPKAAKAAAAAVLAKYPDVAQVWVRRIKDAHLRTIAYVTRDQSAGCSCDGRGYACPQHDGGVRP